MSRRPIAELTEQDSVSQVFLVAEKQLRTNRQGNPYVMLRLADATGYLTAMLWNATEKVASLVEAGGYARVQGTLQRYNGALQMIAVRIDPVDAKDVDEKGFLAAPSANSAQYLEELRDMLGSIADEPLRTLGQAFLADETFLTEFALAPAGIKNHHAYPGGLLEHVVQVMKLAAAIAPLYPQLDRDLLAMGAFLHDVGKLRELSYQREMGYTDEGQLIGHQVIGTWMLDRKIAEVEALTGQTFPAETRVHLLHLILSHHGEIALGAVKLPMTLEALVLHAVDNLDSKVHAVTQMLEQDPASDSRWTNFYPNWDRKFYKKAKKG